MQYLIPILLFAVLALLAGVLLSVFSKVFAVEQDERIPAVREALPGANCGACGYAGCDAYAEAVVLQGAKPTACIPGGAAAAQREDHDAGKGTQHGDALHQRQFLLKDHAGKQHQHDRPQIIGNARHLRSQLRQPIIVQRGIQKNADKAQPSHGGIIPNGIIAQFADIAIADVQNDQNNKCNDNISHCITVLGFTVAAVSGLFIFGNNNQRPTLL